MGGSQLDDETAEWLLSGALGPDDAPSGLEELAMVLRAARSAPGRALADEGALVAAFAAEVRSGPSGRAHRQGGRPVLMKLLPAKAIAIGAVVLIGGGVAAAATGALPTSVQSGVARAAAHVGVSLPDPSHSHGTPPANLFGQCNAYASVSKNYTDFTNPALTRSTAFRRLSAAAQANGETVQGYCASVGTTTTTSSSTTTTSTTTTTTAVTTTTVATPTTTIPANAFGQCNAYRSVTKDYTDFTSPALVNSTAFRRLETTASAQGESVQAYCAPILGLPAPTTTSTSTSTTTTTTEPSSSHGHGNGHGHGHGGGSD